METLKKNIKTNINILPFGTTRIVIYNSEPNEFNVEESTPIYTEIKTTNTPFISLDLDDYSCNQVLDNYLL